MFKYTKTWGVSFISDDTGSQLGMTINHDGMLKDTTSSENYYPGNIQTQNKYGSLLQNLEQENHTVDFG